VERVEEEWEGSQKIGGEEKEKRFSAEFAGDAEDAEKRGGRVRTENTEEEHPSATFRASRGHGEEGGAPLNLW